MYKLGGNTAGNSCNSAEVILASILTYNTDR